MPRSMAMMPASSTGGPGRAAMSVSFSFAVDHAQGGDAGGLAGAHRGLEFLGEAGRAGPWRASLV
jgi:hypothetical protein